MQENPHFVYTADGDEIVNLRHVVRIFLADRSVVAKLADGRDVVLHQASTPQKARAALTLLAQRVGATRP